MEATFANLGVFVCAQISTHVWTCVTHLCANSYPHAFPYVNKAHEDKGTPPCFVLYFHSRLNLVYTELLKHLVGSIAMQLACKYQTATILC